MGCAVTIVKMHAKSGPFAPCPNFVGSFRLPTQKGERIRAGIGGVRSQTKSLGRAFAFFTKELHSAPVSNRRNASATFSQQNKTRRPIFIEGIFFDVRQFQSVRLLTGIRASNCFSVRNA